MLQATTVAHYFLLELGKREEGGGKIIGGKTCQLQDLITSLYKSDGQAPHRVSQC